MDIKEARAVLELYECIDGERLTGGGFIIGAWSPGDPVIFVDGELTAGQLEAIATWMKHHKPNAEAHASARSVAEGR